MPEAGKKCVANLVGPWEMLCAMMRVQAGEKVYRVSRAYGVSDSTMHRWLRLYGSDTAHVHRARALAVSKPELDRALGALREFQAKIEEHQGKLAAVCARSVARDAGVRAAELRPAMPKRKKGQAARAKQASLGAAPRPAANPSGA